MPATPHQLSALVVGRSGDPTATIEKLDTDFLESDELGLRVLWSAVNYKDALATRPDGNVARKAPLIPRIDLVGEVVDAAGTFAVGDIVIAHGYDLGVAHHGGYASHARIPTGWAFPLPAGLSPREAMTLGTAGFTAALSILQLEAHGLHPDTGPVLVTGATGGVGSAAVAMLSGRGYHVVASTGKLDQAGSWIPELGATDVIDRINLPERPKPLNSERWAAAVDSVGGPPLAHVLSEIQYGGGVAVSGLTAGTAFSGSVLPHILRGVALLGTDSAQCSLPRRIEIWERMATDMRPADVSALCGGAADLDKVPAELDRILAGGMHGRTIVRVSA